MWKYLVLAQLFMPSPPPSTMYLPPVEFDRPYTGKITVETVTKDQLLAQCAAATQRSLGCSFPIPGRCRIILVDEASIKAVGWTVEAMLRHERAHCNGWTQDHPGKRPWPYSANEGRVR
jgi:hypothetical protein